MIAHATAASIVSAGVSHVKQNVLMTVELPAREFVTCKACPDFDLCMTCFELSLHGHHPAHAFEPVADAQPTSSEVQRLCEAGRGVDHRATCDGCDKVSTFTLLPQP